MLGKCRFMKKSSKDWGKRGMNFSLISRHLKQKTKSFWMHLLGIVREIKIYCIQLDPREKAVRQDEQVQLREAKSKAEAPLHLELKQNSSWWQLEPKQLHSNNWKILLNKFMSLKLNLTRKPSTVTFHVRQCTNISSLSWTKNTDWRYCLIVTQNITI